jgi:RsmE family RNA methyltransferase
LNRFLFDPSEVDPNSNNDNSAVLSVTLSKDDYRTIHAASILDLRNGDTIRAGLVSNDDHNGFLTDVATIEWLPEGKVKKAEPLKNGDPPGSLRVHLNSLTPSGPSAEIPVSLILALPRPLQLGRILPMVSQLGVDHLVLTQARKVPRDYFGSHLFRKPHLLRERLIEGLAQAGDVILPKIHIVKHLPSFLRDDLDQLFPASEFARVIAHPQRVTTPNQSTLRMRRVSFPKNKTLPRLVLAVGPEGGWAEPEEIDEFIKHGFQQITLGSRVLRSDVAVVSLLSLAHELCYEANSASCHYVNAIQQ